MCTKSLISLIGAGQEEALCRERSDTKWQNKRISLALVEKDGSDSREGNIIGVRS